MPYKILPTPPPGRYNYYSDFENFRNKSNVFSFGNLRSRSSLKGGSFEGNIPGPGAYEVRRLIGSDASKYSLRMKTENIGIH